jgi:hypothetical protein
MADDCLNRQLVDPLGMREVSLLIGKEPGVLLAIGLVDAAFIKVQNLLLLLY